MENRRLRMQILMSRFGLWYLVHLVFFLFQFSCIHVLPLTKDISVYHVGSGYIRQFLMNAIEKDKSMMRLGM